MSRSGEEVEELTSALSAGLGAAQYLAHRLMTLERAGALTSAHIRSRDHGDDSDSVAYAIGDSAEKHCVAMEQALDHINKAAEIMGNRLNDCDGIGDDDPEVTGRAFKMMRRALGQQLPGDQDL